MLTVLINDDMHNDGKENGMRYTDMAKELLKSMILANKSQSFTKLSKAIHGELFALHMVALHDGDISPGEISKIAGTSPARIAAELNSLEHKGLITREIDPNNRRRILVYLTPEGKKREVEHHREAQQVAAGLLSQLGEQDACEYIRLIRKLGEST